MEQIKENRKADEIVNSAKQGNDHLILNINGEKYLVTNFNYFKLGSRDKYIMINNIIEPIEGLNNKLKRSNIKTLAVLAVRKLSSTLLHFKLTFNSY